MLKLKLPGWGLTMREFDSSTHLSSNAASSGNANALSSVPWRRSNVRHTNNELYVDIIEVVTATLAPSGRPLWARASGTVAMTSKISGVPDLLLTLSTPGGGYGKRMAGVNFPVFHPCVRLARWKERPGELSFVPPDGKFVLASYEVDLLPNPSYSTSSTTKSSLHLPVTVEVKKGLGEYSSEFEVRVLMNPLPNSNNNQSSAATNPFPRAIGGRGPGSPGFGGSSNNPVVEDVSITIPLAPGIKTLVNTKASRGEWHYEQGTVSWKIPMSNAAAGTATFRTGVALKASFDDEDEEEEEDEDEEDAVSNSGDYDDGSRKAAAPKERNKKKEEAEEARLQRRRMKMDAQMPRSVLVGFSVKGWLASGVRVDSLQVVHGKGLGEGVKPYKGVKYVTKAGGVEVRC